MISITKIIKIGMLFLVTVLMLTSAVSAGYNTGGNIFAGTLVTTPPDNYTDLTNYYLTFMSSKYHNLTFINMTFNDSQKFSEETTNTTYYYELFNGIRANNPFQYTYAGSVSYLTLIKNYHNLTSEEMKELAKKYCYSPALISGSSNCCGNNAIYQWIKQLPLYNSSNNTTITKTSTLNDSIKKQNLTAINTTVKVSYDQTPPKIINRKIAKNNRIIIKFNESVKKGNKWSKITLKDKKGHIIKIKKQLKNKTLVLKSTKKLKKNKTYVVYMPSGSIKDKSLNKNKAYRFKFKKD